MLQPRTFWVAARAAQVGHQTACGPQLGPLSAAAARERRRPSAACPLRTFYSSTAVSGANALYLEGLYAQWKADPARMDPKWDEYFRSLEDGKPGALPSFNDMRSAASDARISIAAAGSRSGGSAVASSQDFGRQTTRVTARVTAQDESPVSANSFGINHLIRSYQVRGHEMANLDPLGLHQWRKDPPLRELTPQYHGFQEADLDVKFSPSWLTRSSMGSVSGFLSSLGAMHDRDTTLRDLVDTLKATYCNTIGIEYMHISNRKYCNWIRSRVETPLFHMYDQAKALRTYTRLCYSDTFEQFLHEKFKTTKRFGIDGGEAVIPGIKAMMDRMVELGAAEFVIGMPHRGRLNILAGVLKKPMPVILREFMGTAYDVESMIEELESQDWSSAGDVKYHLGTSHVRNYPSGQQVTVTLEANPSHLETVNPVTLGRTKAKQYYMGEEAEDATRAVVPILLHGDASMAGQGVVYETMQLAHVDDFHVGGTIHVIVNNQVGFTTDPKNARSTPYASDLGKAFNVPILHVNADDPLAVVRAFELAGEWRQTWRSDVIIDVICYRRLGHNEADNPEFTQPLLYQAIQKHPRSEQLMAERLIQEGHATAKMIEEIRGQVRSEYEAAWEAAHKTEEQPSSNWLATKWEGFHGPNQLARVRPTGVELATLKAIGAKLCEVPDDFKVHSSIKRILKTKKDRLEAGAGIDWGTAEALAFGTLLLEGNHVRLTGQDVQRGTFSHRHCVVIDQATGEEHTFLNTLGAKERFIARNSILSEYAVLGFELGYSYENPNALILWEAQFGDFANTAQVIIDQFLSAGEHKWLQQSALTLLLPHGYDGQGAEHSSCRVERFLQLCDDDEDDIPDIQEVGASKQIQKSNWQVVNLTTPANYFHALRQQVEREYRKPLIVIAPKLLLRHKDCVSTMEDMGPKSAFQRVIPERDPEIAANAESVDRLVFCTGKVYYELVAERQKLGLKNVAIVTVEMIAPFPFDLVEEQMLLYPNVDKGDGIRPGNIVWCQEEPKNMGAWTYVRPRFVTALRESLKVDSVMRYVGRRASAAPATGLGNLHAREQAALIEAALRGHKGDAPRSSALLGHQT